MNSFQAQPLLDLLDRINRNLARIASALESIDENGVETFEQPGAKLSFREET